MNNNNKYNIFQEAINIMKNYPGFDRLSSSYIKDPKFFKFWQYMETLKELNHYYGSDIFAIYKQSVKKLYHIDQDSYYAIFPENLKLKKSINKKKKKPRLCNLWYRYKKNFNYNKI